ncbi:g protein alpha i subunit [Anaeramoeba flamelloides]|uniref:G protein alpha i subunit n=1 Tax=Anaeramoeba flamelloides TaxID=1746091 RepID=A0ABQ8YWS6_9EUKA|nr:g protein alpha i subunit [Anaeramoeba flamelloides]
MGAANTKKRKYRKEKKKARKLDQQLQISKDQKAKEANILLLGTGDSGKSTMVKQLQILYNNGFSQKEIQDYKRVIQDTIRFSMQNLLRSCEELNYTLKSETESLVGIFNKGFNDHEVCFTKKFGKTMATLWTDPALKKTWLKREKFQIAENSDYFWDNINRIYSEKFQPSNKDILYCRIPTVGVKEILFNIGDKQWRIVDVGGQRNERRKWIHQFENVDLLLFIVGVSEYAKNLYEDKNMNRMHESIKVWKDTLKTNHFKKIPTTIIFNKIDIFKETLSRVSLKHCFPEYTGNDNFEEASRYIMDNYLTKRILKKRDIKYHFTCGTNTEQVQGVVEKLINTIIYNSLEGFLL